jgi:hypothetical protein
MTVTVYNDIKVYQKALVRVHPDLLEPIKDLAIKRGVTQTRMLETLLQIGIMHLDSFDLAEASRAA